MTSHARGGRLARCFPLMFVAAILAVLVPIPGLTRPFDADVPSCGTPAPYAPAGLTFDSNQGQFTEDRARLAFVPCQAPPAVASQDGDAQAPSAGQTSTGSSQGSASPAGQSQGSSVNPITGLAVAPESHYTPLALSQRWKLYLTMTYASAGPYFSPLINALLLDQSNGTPRQWGGGFAGFGRRLASRAGNSVLQGSFQAPLAAVLHEDVRYIPTSNRGFERRALHAVLYSFLTYNDKGQPTLNLANLTAFYASTAVTTIWIPGTGNAAKYTFSNASEQIALSFPLNVAQEFWPEIRRYVFRRH